ncbi:hypothetical protein DFJ77DRAFT_345349 [Powellomyces hirtus]|nr:hypothetical protein DFJ77DRAFT_345349 [Powellomyces hirtus]
MAAKTVEGVTRRLSCAVITVSDRVAASQAEDRSGPALIQMLVVENWEVVNDGNPHVVPDEVDAIQALVKRLVDEEKVDLVLTTGGTGFSPRDVTPEAITGLVDRLAPGLSIAMVTTSLEKTPMAALSRPVCGIRGKSVIVTLPGSTKGSTENLEALLMVLPHAVDLARGDTRAAGDTHKKINDAAAAEDTKHRHHHHHHHHQHAHRQPHHGCARTTSSHQHASHSKDGDDVAVPVAHRARTSPYPMVSFDDALATVLMHAKQLSSVKRTLVDSLGYVLANDVCAAEDVPSFRASIVDGYAVTGTDGPGVYPVISNTTAGSTHSPASTPLAAGQIARITTGAPLPPGATGVIMVEDTTLIQASPDGLTENFVQLHGTNTPLLVPGTNVREIGSDVAKGTKVLPRGARLSPAELALLASVGAATNEIDVVAKPKVVVLSTGNEIADPAEKNLQPGHTRDSNKYFLLNALREERFPATIMNTAKDSAPELAGSIRAALDSADVLITTGGVSMGEMDLLKPVLEKALGATIHFGRVNIKPGKPTTFATLTHTDAETNTTTTKLVFALPGNPASVAVTFTLFVLPALRKMAGDPTVLAPTLKVELADRIPLDPERPEYHRAHVTLAPILATTTTTSLSSPNNTNRFVATSTGSQRSSRVLNLCASNALLKVPAGQGFLERGAYVDAFLVRGLL